MGSRVLFAQMEKVAQAIALPDLVGVFEEVGRCFFEHDELVDSAFFQDRFCIAIRHVAQVLDGRDVAQDDAQTHRVEAAATCAMQP